MATPKNLCINTWSLVNEKQAKIHEDQFNYKIISAEKFPSKESFLELAKNYGKAQIDDDGNVAYLVTPTSAPPLINNPAKARESMPPPPKPSSQLI